MKKCIKCGRVIPNTERAYDVVNHDTWKRIGYACCNCVDTYPNEEVRDPDTEGEKIVTVTVGDSKSEIITLEEQRMRKMESAIGALCDLIMNCMGDAHFYCGTKRCKDDLHDTGCPFGTMRDYRDEMVALQRDIRSER